MEGRREKVFNRRDRGGKLQKQKNARPWGGKSIRAPGRDRIKKSKTKRSVDDKQRRSACSTGKRETIAYKGSRSERKGQCIQERPGGGETKRAILFKKIQKRVSK